MNLLPIYVHNGEVLYNKEGFPEKPSIEDYPHEPIKFAELCMKWDDDLKTSIDKALRFEDIEILKIQIPEAFRVNTIPSDNTPSPEEILENLQEAIRQYCDFDELGQQAAYEIIINIGEVEKN